jgi:hypothetical protein
MQHLQEILSTGTHHLLVVHQSVRAQVERIFRLARLLLQLIMLKVKAKPRLTSLQVQQYLIREEVIIVLAMDQVIIMMV